MSVDMLVWTIWALCGASKYGQNGCGFSLARRLITCKQQNNTTQEKQSNFTHVYTQVITKIMANANMSSLSQALQTNNKQRNPKAVFGCGGVGLRETQKAARMTLDPLNARSSFGLRETQKAPRMTSDPLSVHSSFGLRETQKTPRVTLDPLSVFLLLKPYAPSKGKKGEGT